MRRLLLLLALVALGCSGVSAQGTVRALRYVTSASSQTCADNGNGSTASSVTLTVAEVGYVSLTQSDAQGCVITLSKSGAVDGQELVIVNISSNSATLADSSGVQETHGGLTLTLNQYESSRFIYRSDRWVQDVSAVPATSFVEWWPLAICFDVGGTPSGYEDFAWGTNNANMICTVGSNTAFAAKGFPDATTTYAQRQTLLPSDWTGALDVKFVWYTSATTGNVVWQIQTACSASSETLDPSWNTASTVTQAAQGTTNRQSVATISAVTTTGCAAGELLFVRVFRDASHVSDTLAATANLIGLQVTYRRAM